MNAHDRDTAVLRHLADGPKHELEFVQGAGGLGRRMGQLSAKGVGGRSALRRCYGQGWAVERTRDDQGHPRVLWHLTDSGRAELARRSAS